ncbi:hypothetical protein NPIL_24581 [Nephila pilipes]|uniref:Uncharacterized protein n=1 Tax=Nephila pilipes TaxID=299642 RepID=A0A8X6QR66_NEPPI|nr:hypothetical protein NPIL_24581 [Nephila pilipes]
MGLENDPRSHLPAAMEVTELKALIRSLETDSLQTVRKMTDKLHIHYSTVSQHFVFLDKWMPHSLIDINKRKTVFCCVLCLLTQMSGSQVSPTNCNGG